MPDVVGGITLVPPRAARDCTCVFCGMFRAQHYWTRAVFATVVTALLVVAPVLAESQMRSQHRPDSEVATLVGALMIVATLAAVLALGSWRLPLRRVVHRLRPRRQSV